MRPRSALRPVIIGALTCGALMVSADAAKAYHVMADGTLCPHAKGELQPGESKAAPTVERAASTGPLGATRSSTRSAPAARPAAKPAVKAPVQRPAVQAQAQKPAASQAQAQRPAAAAQPAVSKARVSVPAQRQAQVSLAAQRQTPVAERTGTQQPKAGGSDGRAATQVSPRAVTPVVMPEVTTDSRGATERPTASAVTTGPADSGVSVSTVTLAGLLALCGLVIAGVIGARRRVVRVKSATPLPTFAESADAAIEAELQEIITETRAGAMSAPAVLDDADDDRELSETH